MARNPVAIVVVAARIAGILALVVLACPPSQASASYPSQSCLKVHKLTTPCVGRLIPNSLYLDLWTTHTVVVPRLEAKLAAEIRLRAADRVACDQRLASCNTEVREIEVIVEKRVEVTAPPPIVEWVLVGGVALVVGLVAGILIGQFVEF